MPDLAGKVAWVTGAGSGIGEAAALALAREGCTVALTGRRREPLQAVHIGECQLEQFVLGQAKLSVRERAPLGTRLVDLHGRRSTVQGRRVACEE